MSNPIKIEYALSPNPLTEEPSYYVRVLTRGTLTMDTLANRVADLSGQTPAIVNAVLQSVSQVTLEELLRGNAVTIDGIAQLSPGLSGKTSELNGELSAGSLAGVNIRAASDLVERFKSSAQFVRVDADPLAPSILKVSTVEGTLDAVRPGQVLMVDGSRLGLDPGQPDEGLFFVAPGGAVSRAVTYLDKGEKRLRVLAPNGLVSGTDYTLRVSNRRTPGGPLRSTDATTPLKAA